MCGIAGIWHRDGRPVAERDLELANVVQAHRGPDGCGVWLKGEVGFAHRRLSIVDTSDAGKQPMGTPDGQLWITFNGEIHNYIEVANDLAAAGVTLRSHSDTEIFLWAYRVWGPECFARFNGMWGAAIWDDRRHELILTRDRFGIKPLFVSIRGPRVAFASEIKAILALFEEERRANDDEVHAYLCGASPHSGARTFFRNVTALPPATWLRIGRESSVEKRYWSLPAGIEQPRADAPEALRATLEDAVKIRMRSDVPVGACLSGGLDSSSIVRIAARHTDEMHCFSMRPPNARFDESRFAKIAVRGENSLKLHWIDPGQEGLVDTVAKIVWHHDSPTPTRGRYPQWFTFRRAGQTVKVVLDGQGADELLAGYRRFQLPYLLDVWNARRTHPNGVLREARTVRRIGRGGSLHGHSVVLRPFGKPIWPASRVLDRGFSGRTGPLDMAPFANSWLSRDVERPFRSHLNNALWSEFHFSGLPELLQAEDAIGMAHSVESRPVFLDHRLVELCFSLPFDEKIRNGWSKSVLRRAMEGILPPEIQWRRDKIGFAFPLFDVLRYEPNRRRIEALLLASDARSRAYLDRRGLRRLVKSVLGRRHGKPGYARELLWRCLSLEVWLRECVATGRTRAPAATG